MGCLQCGIEPTFSRGLCRSHYRKGRRSGEIQRVNVRNSGQCAQPGCDRDSFAKGMCAKHYQQAQHPLRSIWRNLRSNAQGAYPPEWDRFEAFLADVGERPSPLHQLRRPNPNSTWSKSNFVWREPLMIDPGERADAQRYAWLWHIRKKYGLMEADLMRMADEQEGKCAICRRMLGYEHPDTGKETKVCIDHDHRTKKVRGLVCDAENKAMGMIDDDVVIAQAIVGYLLKHKED